MLKVVFSLLFMKHPSTGQGVNVNNIWSTSQQMGTKLSVIDSYSLVKTAEWWFYVSYSCFLKVTVSRL